MILLNQIYKYGRNVTYSFDIYIYNKSINKHMEDQILTSRYFLFVILMMLKEGVTRNWSNRVTELYLQCSIF